MAQMVVVGVGENIRWLRAAHVPKLSQDDLAQRVQVSRAAIAHYETERRPLPNDIRTRIARVFGVDESVLADDAPPITAPPLGAPVGFFPPANIRPVSRVSIPYVGLLPASETWGSSPLEFSETIDVPAHMAGPKRFAARIVGDCCTPYLQQGDVVVIEQDLAPSWGSIVVAERRDDHGPTIKQLIAGDGGRPTLKPLNPNHRAPPDGDGWSAIGRLVGVIRDDEGLERTWHLTSGLRPRHLE